MPTGTLADFTASLDVVKWNTITAGFDSQEEYGELTVYMPKFKFSYEKQLNDQLQSMGMIDAFNPYLADLSGISDASIFVSFVKQNTFVEVDEDERVARTALSKLEAGIVRRFSDLRKPLT